MQIKNRERDGLKSKITPEELGRALAAQDLSTIPAHKRAFARYDHFMSVMADSLHNRQVASEIKAARRLHTTRRLSLLAQSAH
jgi:hypothetical protein